MRRSIEMGDGSELNLRRLAIAYFLAQVGNLQTCVDAGVAPSEIDHSVLEGLLADRDPEGEPDQVGVGELPAGPLVAVVEQHVDAGAGELRGDLLGLLFHSWH